MLEQLLNAVKTNATDLIVNNSAVPNQHNDAVIHEAAQITASGLKQAATSGSLQNLLTMFSNNGGSIASLAQNPVVKNIVSNLATKLSNHYGVSATNAQNLAGSLIPQVMNHFGQTVTNPADNSIDINSLLGSLTNGKSGGVDFSSVLNQINGGKNVDVSSLAGQFLGGETKGGLSGLVGKIFGK